MHCNNLIVLKFKRLRVLKFKRLSLKDYVETGVYKITVLCAPLERDLWSEVRRDLNPLRTAYITIQ